MKYIIPQDKIEKIVFKYLDIQYGDVEKFDAEHYDGIIFKKPNVDSEYGIMGWENTNILYISHQLIEEISSMVPIEKSESEKIIGKWVEDRYKLSVVDTRKLVVLLTLLLRIDIN